MSFPHLLPLFAIALLSLTLPRPGERVAQAGALLVALGLASLTVAGGSDWQGAGLPVAYLSLTAALLLLGLALSLGALAVAARRRELTVPAWLTVVPALAVLLLVGRTAVSLGAAGGIGRSLLGFVALAAAGLLLGGIARWARAGDRLRRADRAVFGAMPAPGHDWTGTDRWLLGVHLVLAVVALFAPHLIVLLGAILGTALSGIALERRVYPTARCPLPLLGGLVLLTLASGFLIRVAGEVPLWLGQLRDGPFSAAFELSAAPALIAAAWPLLSLWPFHSRPIGPATVLAGAALLLRVAPILPGGTSHWLPVVFPLLVLSSWYAAGIGSMPLGLSALATAGLISLDPAAAWAGVALLGAVGVAEVVRRLDPPAGVQRFVLAAATVPAVTLAATLLVGALQAQTFYTVLLVLGLASTLPVDAASSRLLQVR